MNKAARNSNAMNLLAGCGQAYFGDFSFANDLPSVQSVSEYMDPINQRKYVHMYFAKNVGLWRAVRSEISINPDKPVYSIGAGPCLDLFGLAWDAGPHPSPVIAVDPLPWAGIRDTPQWKDLAALLVPNLSFNHGLTVPDPGLVTQSSCVKGLASFPSANVADGATVVFAWTLNHLFGALTPMAAKVQTGFKAWIEDVVSRGGRVVIADMQIDKRTRVFWNNLRMTLGVSPEAQPFHFVGGASDLGVLYDSQGTRRTNPKMLVATVLVIEASGSVFLT